MDEPLFCISNIRSLSKAYLSCCCTASDWLWKSWMSDSEAFFYVYTVYFHKPSPSANMYRFKQAFSVFFWAQMIYQSLVGGLDLSLSFHSEPTSLHKVFGLNVLTSNRFNNKRALVLVMQCPTSLCCCHTVSRHLNVTHRSYPKNTVRSILLS